MLHKLVLKESAVILIATGIYSFMLAILCVEFNAFSSLVNNCSPLYVRGGKNKLDCAVNKIYIKYQKLVFIWQHRH